MKRDKIYKIFGYKIGGGTMGQLLNAGAQLLTGNQGNQQGNQNQNQQPNGHQQNGRYNYLKSKN